MAELLAAFCASGPLLSYLGTDGRAPSGSPDPLVDFDTAAAPDFLVALSVVDTAGQPSRARHLTLSACRVSADSLFCRRLERLGPGCFLSGD